MHPKNMFTSFCFCALLCVPAVAQTSLNQSDKDFLTMAAKTDMTEAHMGQMAQEQAEDSGVKDFGQQLITDHTKDYANLTELATKVGADIPKGIDAHRDRSIEALVHLKGKAFDRRFLQEQIQGHEKVDAACKREAEHGQNADVKAFAAQMDSMVEEHLHKAQDLAKPAKPKM